MMWNYWNGLSVGLLGSAYALELLPQIMNDKAFVFSLAATASEHLILLFCVCSHFSGKGFFAQETKMNQVNMCLDSF